MRITFISSIVAVFLSLDAVAASPMDMTVDRLFGICESANVQSAMARGDELGWSRLTEAETEEWRTSFTAYNGGTVEIVGWRRVQAGGADSLSFWVAVGPNGHKACSYSTHNPDGLLSSLSERLGPPDTIDREDAMDMTSAYWTRGELEYFLAQTGEYATFSVVPGQ